jgi:replication factor A1
MKISDLKPGTGNADVEADVVSVDEPREVLTKIGRRTRVANATIKDESGEITLTLWGDDIDRVKEGDKISIEKGWVSEFKGAVQISAGKYGKITVK